MGKSKKRRLHRCKNHPAVIAKGKCCSCGQWICKECALLKQGSFYCHDTCISSLEKNKPIHSIPRREIQSSDVDAIKDLGDKKKYAFIPLVLAITLVIVLLATIMLAIKNHSLQKRLSNLTFNRRQLVKELQDRNVRITLLKDSINQLTRPPMESLAVKKKQKSFPPIQSNRAVPSFKKMPLTFDNGVTHKSLVSITFDGGSHTNAAQNILDTLRSRNVISTFFVTGNFIRRNKKLINNILHEGHELGNHLYSHPHLTLWDEKRAHETRPEISAEFLGRELIRTNKLFKEVTGRDLAPFWRAPYGEKNAEICKWALFYGYVHIGWRQGRTFRVNLDTNDWIVRPDQPGYYSPEEVYQKLQSLAKAPPYGMRGGIILMHLGTLRKAADQQVHYKLGAIIDMIRDNGYQIVPISVLLKESGVNISVLNERRLKIKHSNKG